MTASFLVLKVGMNARNTVSGLQLSINDDVAR